MHFGIFLEESRPGLGPAEAFQETLDLVDAAEAWGLDSVWLAEMHFNPARSVLCAPLIVAGHVAARTRRVRIGTAVQLLPLNHPLRVAGEVATLDHLSHGRFDFGVGRSGSPRSYDALGVPYGESQARFLEALEIIREAWKGQPFSYHGKFHRFETTTVAPRPLQVPHPPIRMASNSAETFPMVGRLGLQIFLGLRDVDLPELRVRVRTYRQAWRDAGHPGEGSAYVRMPVYAAPTQAAALEEPREAITHFFRRQANLTIVPVGRAGTGTVEARQSRAARLGSLTYEDILDKRVAFGSAASLVDRLGMLRDEVGLDGVVAELNPGGLLSAEAAHRTLRILTHEVMPRLR